MHGDEIGGGFCWFYFERDTFFLRMWEGKLAFGLNIFYFSIFICGYERLEIGLVVFDGNFQGIRVDVINSSFRDFIQGNFQAVGMES